MTEGVASSIPSFERMSEPQKVVAVNAKTSGYDLDVRDAGDDDVSFYLIVPGTGGYEHSVFLTSLDCQRLQRAELQNYTQLGRYAAILDEKSKKIYALLAGDAPIRLRSYFFPDSTPERYEPDFSDESVVIADNLLGCRVTVELTHDPARYLLRGLGGALALLVLQTTTSEPERALELLEKIGPSLCFDLDRRTNVLVRVGRSRARPRASEPTHRRLPASFSTPRNQYDPDALELYFEARESSGPTTEFLLFYQVLESFFGQAVQENARSAVERVLLDTRYVYGSPEQVRSLVSSAQSYSSGTTERAQLDLLLNLITDRVDLLELAALSAPFKDFMGARRQALNGVEQLRFEADNDNLLRGVGQRIYVLRNRIVHAKRTEQYTDAPPLWPTSPETRHLTHDVALVRHLAQRALIRFSTSIG